MLLRSSPAMITWQMYVMSHRIAFSLQGTASKSCSRKTQTGWSSSASLVTQITLVVPGSVSWTHSSAETSCIQ